MIKAKDIKSGYIYKVKVPNPFNWPGEPENYYFRELVLARNRNTMFALVLDGRVPKKDRIKLSKYTVRQLIHNDDELLAKYDEQLIGYEVKGNTILSPMNDEVEFVKKYKYNKVK